MVQMHIQQHQFVIFLFISCLIFPYALNVQAEVPGQGISKKTELADTSDRDCEQRIYEKLQTIGDPEFDITIVDFGLVSEVRCDADKNTNSITLIPTSPLCPYLKDLVAAVKDVSKELYPRREAKVIVDLETRWTPSLMTEKGRKQFWGEEK